jgi:hypothetical protein
MERRSPEDLPLLSAELARLTKAQEDALKTAVYLPMNPEEEELYGQRRQRIKKLREMLEHSQAS